MNPTASRSIEEWTEQIKQDVRENRVFVYAKGEKNAAMCGFSARVMQILNQVGTPFEVRNIFADPNIRPAICAYTNWPTIPQVFIDGNFVGGCDILTEMYQSGELEKMLDSGAAERRQ
ncbi:MAG TPA: Grx4 family monothiol glutaredoxin [Candidatus Polarisedimenticolaceae bacterium]|nr:Grx4 family monothiol glutaredoxin [Candidatus Polarisedimenticolaceae bacterium]